MKVPGEALLQFDVEEEGSGRTRLTLRARFLPRGLWGIIYWYALAPVHGPLFRGMLTSLARKIGGKILSGPSTPPKEASTCRIS
jgi:hypothetical protein